MLKEFKDFAVKGNVLDMAVGIIIGAAFGTIVTSLVADVVMPPIGLALGGVDFTYLFSVPAGGRRGAWTLRVAGRCEGSGRGHGQLRGSSSTQSSASSSSPSRCS